MAKEKLNRNGDRRGMSPNSQKNLGKGRLGNNHANKESSVTRKIREILEIETDYILPNVPAGKRTWGDLVAWSIVLGAVRGDARKQVELLDRTEGKLPVPVKGEMSGTVILKVKYDDSDR